MERRVDSTRRKVAALQEDLRSLDGVVAAQNSASGEDHFRRQGLAKEIEELKRANQILQDEKQ